MWKPFPLLLIFVVISCSTGPEFDRSNDNDPGNKNFSPNPPSGTNYTFHPDTTISIRWRDMTNFETKYLIYKSLGQNTPFQLIAELDENATSFTDSSKVLAFPTIFHVVAESESRMSDTVAIEIDFGSISTFEAEIVNSQVNLNWHGNVVFSDGYLITRTPDTRSETTYATTVPSDQSSVDLEISNDGFFQSYYLSPFKISKGDTTYLPESELTIQTGGPNSVNLSISAVDSLYIQWNDWTTFQNNYKLDLFKNGSLDQSFELDPIPNSFRLYKEIEANASYKVRLSAIYGETSSPIVSSNTLDIGDIASPVIDSVISLSSSSLQLYVKDTPVIERDIEVFRSTNSSTDFVSLGVLAKGDSIFTDINLDKGNSYTYVLKTSLSPDSSPYSVYFKPGLSFKRRVYNTERTVRNFQYSASTNQLVYVAGTSESRADYLYFLNLDSFSTIRTPTPTSQYVRYIKMNSTGDQFALYDRSENSDKIFLYDTNSKELLETLTIEDLDVAKDMVFSPDDQNIYISSQLRDPVSRQYRHELLNYDLLNDTLKTVANRQLGIFYTNYNTRSVYLLNTFFNSEATLYTYRFVNGDIQYMSLDTFNSRLISSNSAVITSSANMDTLVISSDYHDHENGIIRYHAFLDQVIDSTSILINDYPSSITGVYYDQDYTLGQVYDGVYIMDHTSGKAEVVDYFKYDSDYQFKYDFMYIRDKNMLIDARSYYGEVQYLESSFRVFEVKEQWREVYVHE